MSCCGLKIQTARNADMRRIYTPNEGYTFSTFTARMQVRASQGAPDPALLDIGMAPTVNGSGWAILGSSLVLTIKQADLESLPVASPISDPMVLYYDVIFTDASGFSTNIVGGPFVLIEGVTR